MNIESIREKPLFHKFVSFCKISLKIITYTEFFFLFFFNTINILFSKKYLLLKKKKKKRELNKK